MTLFCYVIQHSTISHLFKVEEIWRNAASFASFGITKRSPYKPFMNNALQKLAETGQLHKIFAKWSLANAECSVTTQTKTPLSFKKLIGHFFIIIFGVLFALSILMYENYTFNKNWKMKDISCVDAEMWRFELIIAEIHENFKKKLQPSPEMLSLLKEAQTNVEAKNDKSDK